MNLRIGYFGAGNMAQAIALGIYKNATVQYFFSPSGTKARELASKVDGHFVENLSQMPLDLDWYILAFKPQSLGEFDFSFSKNSKILSLLAGVSLLKLNQKWNDCQFARLMPNTPSRLGSGANLFYSPISQTAIITLKNLLEISLGKLFILTSENALDQLTVVTASGPAFIFEFARHFESYAQEINQKEGLGLTPETIKELIASTFLGSGKLLSQTLETGENFSDLRDQVASKKGVTARGLESFENNQFQKLTHQAFLAAYQRVLELKKNNFN